MMSEKVHVFIDNSNLWIEGKKISGRRSRPPVPSNYRYRMEYGRLLQHVLENRDLAAVPKLYGSEAPPNDSVWNMIRSKGFNVTVFKRNIYNKEKGVDMRMGLDISRLVLKEKPPSRVIIVVGDDDFVQVVDDVHAEGWKVEVCTGPMPPAILRRRSTVLKNSMVSSIRLDSRRFERTSD
jgi:uncharacterized LabA/DUF88 family protein